jgi:hypothetical protein
LKLQEIFQDERLSVQEAIVEGWKLFLEPEQYPVKYCGVGDASEVWSIMSAEHQTRFTESLTLNEEKLREMVAQMKQVDIAWPLFKEEESLGCLHEFNLLGFKLDIDHPALTEPDSARRMPECPICKKILRKAEIGSIAEHRPVQTSCGHLFRNSSIVDAFGRNNDDVCPQCGKRVEGPRHPFSPGDVMASCDRVLMWVQQPISFEDVESPDSTFEKLLFIFQPADEIRRRMQYWTPYERGVLVEWARMKDTGAYLARERLAATLKGDATRYREVVRRQMQVAARRQWLGFLDDVLP